MPDAALQLLLDKDALREIALRYARAIDRVDQELLRSVYHPDATDDHGAAFTGPASDFIAQLPAIMTQFEITQHSISNCFYRFDGDRADGELYFNAYHRTKEPAAKHVIVQGRYIDNYERRNGVWKIAYRRLVWDSLQTFDVAAADAAQLRALGAGGALATDRSYEALPLMARGQ